VLAGEARVKSQRQELDSLRASHANLAERAAVAEAAAAQTPVRARSAIAELRDRAEG
jgi:hypothetical protein